MTGDVLADHAPGPKRPRLQHEELGAAGAVPTHDELGAAAGAADSCWSKVNVYVFDGVDR